MSFYSIAGLSIDIQNKYDFTEKQCAKYAAHPREGERLPADFSVAVSDDDIEKEREGSEYTFSDGYLESIAIYRKICEKLPSYDALLLHSSVIEVGGRGIAFLAQSGVGKTTHTNMWSKLCGEDMCIINGDKPIIRFFGGEPFAFGTPWCGKEGFNTNKSCRLTDLCFIERGAINKLFPTPTREAVGKIMAQILLTENGAAVGKTFELLDALLKQCRLWTVQCTPTVEAAKCAYDAIFGGNG